MPVRKPQGQQNDLFANQTPSKDIVEKRQATLASVRNIERLKAWHRKLSEQILEANRELSGLSADVHVVLSDQADPAFLQALARKEELQAKRNVVEQDIGHALQVLKSEKGDPQGDLSSKEELSDEEDATELEAQSEKGLIRQRHPNRDFFLADLFDYALKDDGASMEAPIFTLSTKPDLSVWQWQSKDKSKSLKVTPSVLGRATQHDKDVLIYVVSQVVEGLNRERDDASHKTVRFTVYDFLVTTNRQTSGDGYKRLHEAFERLRGTSITTDIKTGGARVREGFGIIDKWKIIEKSPTDDRMIAVEVTLSDWLYNAVQAFEVLTIHSDYFRLRKPLARRIYEIARKHCGRQARWSVGLALLQEKSGSKSTLKEFRRAIRGIEEDDSLPEYCLKLSADDKVTFYARDTRLFLEEVKIPPCASM